MNASCVAIVGFKCLPESPDEAPRRIGEEPPPAELKAPDEKELKPWGPVLMPWISPIPVVFGFLLSSEWFLSPLELFPVVV